MDLVTYTAFVGGWPEGDADPDWTVMRRDELSWDEAAMLLRKRMTPWLSDEYEGKSARDALASLESARPSSKFEAVIWGDDYLIFDTDKGRT